MQYQFLLDATAEFAKLYIIKDENTIVYEKHYLNEKNLSHSLSTYIEECFKALNIWYSDINKLFLVYGPGKFSSMRISSVFIKTFATLFAIPIFLIDKFDYIANDSDCICVVKSDGDKQFVVQYAKHIQITEPKLLNVKQLNEYLLDHAGIKIYYDIDDQINNISNRLSKFKKADDNFTLMYLKAPC